VGEIIGVKWVLKTKLNEKGEADKYKAQLIAKRYSQNNMEWIFLKCLHQWLKVVVSLAIYKS